MSPEEAAWLAGLIEGEGSLHFKTNKSGKRYGRIVVEMTDEDIVRRAASVAGCGTVNGPYTRPAHPDWKPSWRWTTCTQAEVLEVITLILPWLGERRTARAHDLIDAMIEFAPEITCTLLDAEA